jgi:hypothetical protein
MKNKILSGLLILSGMLIFTSCNKAPETEVEAAKLAITEVQVSGADVYLADEFNALNDSMNSIMLGIEAKKSKWFANYNDEKGKLNLIVEQAMTVRQNTEIRKGEIKNEIMTSLNEIKTLLDENQKLLSEAPKGKEGTAVLVAIKDELSVLNASVSEIMKMVDSGDYLTAQNKLPAVNDKTLAINNELKEAMAKYNKHRGGK